jgi:hypothetical protein
MSNKLPAALPADDPEIEQLMSPDTPAGDPREPQWEHELAELLAELTDVQDRLLDVLSRKRHLMARGDTRGMAELEPLEHDVSTRLEACQQRRQALLDNVQAAGVPARNLTGLAATLRGTAHHEWRRDLDRIATRMRWLQHHTLTNWVVAQRTLLHLAHLLEIIATGGRQKPTYGNADPDSSRGVLVDHEV